MTQELHPAISKWTPRQVVLATLFITMVVVGFLLLYRFRSVIFVLFLAILLGTAIKPAVAWMAKLGIPRAIGEILVFIVLFAAVIGFLLLAVPLILEQSTALGGQLSEYYQAIRKVMLLSPSSLIKSLGFRLPFQLPVENLMPTPAAPASPNNTNPTVDTVAQVFRLTGLVTRSLFSIIAVLLMGFYWTLESERAIRSLLLLVPISSRDSVRSVVDAIETKLGGFLLGQAILCLTIGGMQLVAYLLIGLPNALALALFAGVMELIPTIGPALGALPGVLIASTTDSNKIVWVLVSTALVQLIENNLLVPRVMDKSVGVNPVVTLLSLAALSSLLGLPGALLAIPTAAIIQVIIDRYVFNPDEAAQIKPEGRGQVSLLRYQAQEIAQDIRKQVRNKEDRVDRTVDQVEDAIETLANDLDRVLAQVAQEEGGQA